MNRTFLIVLKVIGETIFLYGLLGWSYGVLIQLIFPSWMNLPLSHLTPWLRLDTFTILSFISSTFGFLFFKICKEMLEKTSRAR